MNQDNLNQNNINNFNSSQQFVQPNSSFNVSNKTPKKNNLGLIIGIVVVATIIGFGAFLILGNKNNDDGHTNTVANEDYFEWSLTDDTMIVGYTEEGLKQTELVIPKKATSVQGLKENKTVKYISFENPNTKILSNAFRNCTSLEQINLPDNLSTIEDSILNGASSLKSIVIPENVIEIGSNFCLDCESLEEITFGNNIIKVGRDAFKGASSLKRLVLPNSVEEIAKGAFENNTSLEEIVFGTGLKTIGESAFQKCTSVKTVKLPDGIEKLDIWAFAYMDSLQDMYIPTSLNTISVSSIVQIHNFNVHITQGSYIDGQIDNLMSPKFINKIYQ